MVLIEINCTTACNATWATAVPQHIAAARLNKQFRFVHQMKSSLRKQHFSSIHHKHSKDERFEILHESKFSRTASHLKCRTSNWIAKHIDLHIPNKMLCTCAFIWITDLNFQITYAIRGWKNIATSKFMVLIWIAFSNAASMTNCNSYNYNT